jgi:EmrB/QacA subfamily drug resistance transporter
MSSSMSRSSATATSPAGPAQSRSRWLALGVIATSSLMLILDGSIVTVALPSIQRDLAFGAASLSWVMNAYLLAFGGLLLLAGRLGDLLGRKRMFLGGLAVFVLASLLAGASHTAAELLAARFLQGVGGAAAGAVSLGIIVTLFTDPAERTRAMGVFAFTGAAGASIGQVLGGVLTDGLGWHWIFLINLPIGLATLALAARSVPDDRGLGLRAGADVLGAALVTGGLMLAIYTVVKASDAGWGSRRTLGLGALAAALIAGFVLRQAKANAPLMPLRILRSRNVSGANVVQILMIGAMFAFQIVVALDMQQVLGYSALKTGLAMLPAAVTIGVTALAVSARLTTRLGPRTVTLIGLVMLTAALALLLRLPVHATYATDLLPTMLLIAGGGLAMPALAGLGMSGARPQDAGLASGLYNTTAQIGAAGGAALLATLAAGRSRELVRHGRSTAEALTGGYHLAFGIGAALMVAAIAVAVWVLRPARSQAAGSDEPATGPTAASASASNAEPERITSPA